MLFFYDNRFVFFIHTLYCLASISTKVFITRPYGILNVHNFLLTKVLQIFIFCPHYFLFVLSDFNFHLINKADSYRVQKLQTEAKPHICKNNKEKGPTTFKFNIFHLKLQFLLSTNN